MSKTIYWSAPSAYFGNKVAAYGGAIYYTTLIGSVENVTAPALQPAELILAGANMELAHYASSSLRHGSNRIELVEWHFVHKTTGSSVTRDQLLIVLASLDQLKLRATFFAAQSHPSRLLNFSMEVADPSKVRDSKTNAAVSLTGAALSVEKCTCPKEYAGSSCERCAPNYYRAKNITGPGLFNCLPCKCSLYTKECDQETGECKGCKGNTIGHNCEKCAIGFFKKFEKKSDSSQPPWSCKQKSIWLVLIYNRIRDTKMCPLVDASIVYYLIVCFFSKFEMMTKLCYKQSPNEKSYLFLF